MHDHGELVLDDAVAGSLQETLVLRGTAGGRALIVFFSAEILDHWPREIQADRLNEMLPFIEGATRRAMAKREFSVVTDMMPDDRDALVVVLGWSDIAH